MGGCAWYAHVSEIRELGKGMCYTGGATRDITSTKKETNMSEATYTAGINVGQFFPDLVLPDMNDGTPGSVASYRGKRVLLHNYASW